MKLVSARFQWTIYSLLDKLWILVIRLKFPMVFVNLFSHTHTQSLSLKHRHRPFKMHARQKQNAFSTNIKMALWSSKILRNCYWMCWKAYKWGFIQIQPYAVTKLQLTKLDDLYLTFKIWCRGLDIEPKEWLAGLQLTNSSGKEEKNVWKAFNGCVMCKLHLHLQIIWTRQNHQCKKLWWKKDRRDFSTSYWKNEQPVIEEVKSQKTLRKSIFLKCINEVNVQHNICNLNLIASNLQFFIKKNHLKTQIQFWRAFVIVNLFILIWKDFWIISSAAAFPSGTNLRLWFISQSNCVHNKFICLTICG